MKVGGETAILSTKEVYSGWGRHRFWYSWKPLLYNLIYNNYIWIEVTLLKETPKAILIMFDGRKAWLPKAWIVRIKRNKNSNTIRIKISEYHWTKKFW